MLPPKPPQLPADIPALQVVAACASDQIADLDVNLWALHAWRTIRTDVYAPPNVIERIDDWTLRMVEFALSPDVTVQASGSTDVVSVSPRIVQAAVGGRTFRPKPLRTLDEKRTAIDRATAVKVQTIADEAISRFLTRAGMRVTAAIRSPEIAQHLADIDFEDIPSIALSVELRPGRTIAAAAGVDFQKLLDEASAAASKAVKRALVKADGDALKAVKRTLGQVVGTSEVTRKDRLGSALSYFDRKFRESALGSIGDTTDPDFEVGATVRPKSFPPADVFGTLAEAGGSEPGRLASLQASGTAFSDELTNTVDAAAASLADGEDYNETLRRLVNQTRAGGKMVSRRVWAHALLGTPEVPFPPHEALDGLLAEDPAITDGDSVFGGPANTSWHPGDHKGCTCGWSIETTMAFDQEPTRLTTERAPAGEPPPPVMTRREQAKKFGIRPFPVPELPETAPPQPPMTQEMYDEGFQVLAGDGSEGDPLHIRRVERIQIETSQGRNRRPMLPHSGLPEGEEVWVALSDELGFMPHSAPSGNEVAQVFKQDGRSVVVVSVNGERLDIDAEVAFRTAYETADALMPGNDMSQLWLTVDAADVGRTSGIASGSNVVLYDKLAETMLFQRGATDREQERAEYVLVHEIAHVEATASQTKRGVVPGLFDVEPWAFATPEGWTDLDALQEEHLEENLRNGPHRQFRTDEFRNPQGHQINVIDGTVYGKENSAESFAEHSTLYLYDRDNKWDGNPLAMWNGEPMRYRELFPHHADFLDEFYDD